MTRRLARAAVRPRGNTEAVRYRRRPELRSRVFRLGSPGLIVNKLPPAVDVVALQYRVVDRHVVVTDLAGFSLDINEFGTMR